MLEGRWALALAAGLVLVVVSIAMIAGFQGDEPDSRHRAPRVAPSDDDDWAETESQTEAESEADDRVEETEEEPPDGIRELVGIATNSNNEPLEGVELEVEDHANLRTVSDKQGEFRLHSVPSQAVTLVARATGYAATQLNVKRSEPDAQQTVNIALKDGDGAAGSVVDPDGGQVAAARVGCVDDANKQQTVSTDRYGRFALPDEAIGCEAVASYQGFDDSAAVFLELGSDNMLVLARLASVAGTVADADGRPPRSFVISVESFEPAGGGEASKRYRQTFSNPRGSFKVQGLKAGRYVFGVGLPGGKQLRTQPIDVKRGEQRTGLRIDAR